jgi:carboxy-cis,cis-muconate cyclase
MNRPNHFAANYVDVYEIQSKTLKHIQSGSVTPPNVDRHSYRGNTLRLSRDGKFLFASTRGATKETRGYMTAFELDSTGRLASLDAVDFHQTPTSCGIAGAIEPAFWKGSEGIAGQDYLLHVDEETGFVRVLGWSGALKRFQEIASTQLPDGATASHAIWLS